MYNPFEPEPWELALSHAAADDSLSAWDNPFEPISAGVKADSTGSLRSFASDSSSASSAGENGASGRRGSDYSGVGKEKGAKGEPVSEGTRRWRLRQTKVLRIRRHYTATEHGLDDGEYGEEQDEGSGLDSPLETTAVAASSSSLVASAIPLVNNIAAQHSIMDVARDSRDDIVTSSSPPGKAIEVLAPPAQEMEPVIVVTATVPAPAPAPTKPVSKVRALAAAFENGRVDSSPIASRATAYLR